MKILVGDLRLFVDVEGASLRVDGPQMRQAPTLLLLHGGPFIDHSMFKPEHSQLCDAAQLVYLDHRGRGRSERGDRAKWNLEQWGNDVHAFCDALEIEMMGVSFGGIVAMSYATRHPEHAAGLILCSTMARWRDERSLGDSRNSGDLMRAKRRGVSGTSRRGKTVALTPQSAGHYVCS